MAWPGGLRSDCRKRMFAYRIDDDLELRMLEERHAQELFEVIDRDREDLRTWLPWVDGSRSADDITAFIRSAGQELAAGRGLTCGIWHHGRLVGTIGLRVDPAHHSGEIGYWLAREARGQGIMTRATRALVDHGFGDLELHRIVVRCATGTAPAAPSRSGWGSPWRACCVRPIHEMQQQPLHVAGVRLLAGPLRDHIVDGTSSSS
jgi:ribosomal-protein-serine acetyltransferase